MTFYNYTDTNSKKITMTDIRAARQAYSDNKLEILNKVLNQLDDDNDSTPMTKLCRKAGMSLKLHHRYADHFRNDWGTYGEACDALEKECMKTFGV